jgi:anti-sigma regulatory factor (Ser/Thr protein kinase)
MEDLSLHILDIAENSIEAKAKKIKIKLVEDSKKDILSLEIADDGKGMDKETLKKAIDPFFTTRKTRRFGLGLPLLAEAAKAANGRFTIQSKPGQGTTIKASFQASHIDTKPLGDIAQTMLTLIIGHPEVEIDYRHRVNRSKYTLNTKDIKAQLNGVPLSSPKVIKFIKNNIKEGLENLRRKK